jgi:hypothetical protein
VSPPVIPLKWVAYFLEILAFAAIFIIYRSLSNYFDRCKEGESPVDKIVRKRIANNVSDSLEGSRHSSATSPARWRGVSRPFSSC